MKAAYKKIAWASAAVTCLAWALPVAAQNRVYRCGNEYTNDIHRIERGGCTPLTGGNLTIVRGGPVRTSVTRTPTRATPQRIPLTTPDAPAPARTASVEDGAQRARDAGARGILQMELDKANQRLAELQKEYNNGNPEKLGPETRNHQKYLDRVASLKSSIARTESDIQGIRRELGRAGG